MDVIGVDTSKKCLSATVLGQNGVLGALDVANTEAGWGELLTWAQQWPDRCWGIEGSYSSGYRLAQTLVAAGEQVFEVSARLTAAGRRRAPRRGKSDRLDSRAVARVVRDTEVPLPHVQLDDEVSLAIQVLTHRRNTVVARQTEVRNQLHALLLRCLPEYERYTGSLRGRSGLEHVRTTLEELCLTPAVQQIAEQLLDEFALLHAQEQTLAGELAQLIHAHFPQLLSIPGVGVLVAAGIISELGRARPGLTEAQLAMLAGIAPLEASTAGAVRHRLNRGGNRQLNRWFHAIALTQLRVYEPAKLYIARRRSLGNTAKEALRALKRHLVRSVYRQWMACQHASLTTAAS